MSEFSAFKGLYEHEIFKLADTGALSWDMVLKNVSLTFHLVVLRGILIALIELGPMEENMNPLFF